MCILIAGVSKNHKGTRGENKSRSNMKKNLKLHLYEQVTFKTACWVLEMNRWCFTSRQTVLRNLKTSKGPLHCCSFMDPSETSLVEKIVYETREAVSRDRATDTSRRSIPGFLWTPQNFLVDFQSFPLGKNSQKWLSRGCMLSGKHQILRGPNLQNILTVADLKITTSIMMYMCPHLHCPVSHPW